MKNLILVIAFSIIASSFFNASYAQDKITVKGINIDMRLSEVISILTRKGFSANKCPVVRHCREFRRPSSNQFIRWEKNQIVFDCEHINACEYSPIEVMQWLKKGGAITSFEANCDNELCFQGIGKAGDIINVSKMLALFPSSSCKNLSTIAKLMKPQCVEWIIELTNSTQRRKKLNLN